MTSLGIAHLKNFWERAVLRVDANDQCQWVNDNTMLSGLSLGLREAHLYLNTVKPTFEQFEHWILEQNGGSIEQPLVDRINHAIAGRVPRNESQTRKTPPTPDHPPLWDENGYVILHNAVDPENCRGAAAAIFEFLGATPDDPNSWYRNPIGHTIWVPLLRHPAFVANRHSPRIHAAFAQIWGRRDLWVNTDQCGFNPPEREGWTFPGPYLHWDSSLAFPLVFGTQAILYLTDTDADQGAFQCVPGFHRKLAEWLTSLPPGADPRQQDLSSLAKPIAGKAGDLVIWHQALPHGSSPNRAKRPRVVQYLNLRPSQWDFNPTWK